MPRSFNARHVLLFSLATCHSMPIKALPFLLTACLSSCPLTIIFCQSRRSLLSAAVWPSTWPAASATDTLWTISKWDKSINCRWERTIRPVLVNLLSYPILSIRIVWCLRPTVNVSCWLQCNKVLVISVLMFRLIADYVSGFYTRRLGRRSNTKASRYRLIRIMAMIETIFE